MQFFLTLPYVIAVVRHFLLDPRLYFSYSIHVTHRCRYIHRNTCYE
jgi:hypothetical protein